VPTKSAGDVQMDRRLPIFTRKTRNLRWLGGDYGLPQARAQFEPPRTAKQLSASRSTICEGVTGGAVRRGQSRWGLRFAIVLRGWPVGAAQDRGPGAGQDHGPGLTA